MIIVLCLRWWYGAGWRWIWDRVLVERLVWVNEVFSTTDLLKTLFAPYRQTFAGQVRGNLGAQFRAFVDRTISRIIGAIVRFFLIITAIIGSIAVLLVAIITIIAWPFLPWLPLISLYLMLSEALV